MNSNLKILLLNGPLQGSTLPLPLGSFKLGEGGDLWARFESKTPTIPLDVQKESVRALQDLPCWINGQLRPVSETSRKTPLPLRTPIDLDGLGFLLLPIDEAPENLPQALWQLPPRHRPIATESSPASPPVWEALGPTLDLLKNLAWLALVGAGGGWFALKRVQTWQRQEVLKQWEASKAWLEAELKKPLYQEIQAEFGNLARIELKGRCRSTEALQALVQPLKRKKWFVRTQVYCDDELVQNVLYTLRLFGFDAAQASPGERLGSVLIQGDIEGNGQWQKVESFLSELPGLKSWTVTNPQAERLERLVGALQEVDLQSKLDVIQKGERFLLTGRTSPGEAEQLQNIFEWFQKEYPESQCIYQNIKAALHQEEIWPAPIVSIGGSHQHPFIELSNGLRLQVGSHLASGYQIVDIDERGIRLMKRNKLVNVPIDLSSPYLA